MHRRIKALAVVAMLAAALVAPSAVGAEGKAGTAPNCEYGNDTAYFSPGGEHRSQQATDSLDKVYFGKCLA